MQKLAFFFIDDVIMTFRDIARDRPKSIFDHPFMAALKKPHDIYGMTVQLNLFYRTDFAYGSKEFTLADMPDCYKAEFEENSGWLKLAFHAKQEFPDFPYPNADYDDLKADYTAIFNEVCRFAGEKSWSYAMVPHWGPISLEGCKALADCGLKFMSPDWGEPMHYNGDPDSLPYGYAFRLMQRRKPETDIFYRYHDGGAVERSIRSHNFLPYEVYDPIVGKNESVFDEKTGLRIRSLWECILNLVKYEDIEALYAPQIGNEFIGTGNHEQYFFKDYFAYQPDYADKILLVAKLLHENGYRYITYEEFK